MIFERKRAVIYGMSKNVFLYSLVAHKQKILAEYSTVPEGNVQEFAVRILSVVNPKKNQWSCWEDNNCIFHVLADQDSYVYMCLTEKTARPQLRMNYLEDLRTKWRTKYSNVSPASMPAYGQSNEFKNQFILLFSTYNSERADKIAKIKEDLQKTQDKTTENLKLALERGEQLRVMADKAEKIKSSAQAFRREASKVKCNMLWQRIRWYVIISIVLIILIIGIAMFACGGPSFAKCKSGGGAEGTEGGSTAA